MLAVSSSLRKQGKKYLAVMTLVAVATGINFFLRKVANDNEIFESLYFPIVVASSIFFGVGPGLAASVLSVLALDYFFVEPLYSFGPPADMTGWFVLVSFIATTLLVNRLLLIYQNTRRNLEKSEQRFRCLTTPPAVTTRWTRINGSWTSTIPRPPGWGVIGRQSLSAKGG